MERARKTVVILNIPPNFHVPDLRSFFSSAIESDSFFRCFHFRHRPQKELVDTLQISYPPQSKQPSILKGQIFSKALIENAVCAIVECLGIESKALFLKRYHFENWITATGTVLPARCVLADVTVINEDIAFPLDTLKISNKITQIQIPSMKLRRMVEFVPPVMVMPKGNVGTPTQHFKQLIKKCQLPSKLIRKLGLSFSKQKSRKYGCVPYEYEANRSKVPESNVNDQAQNKHQARATPTNTQENDSSEEEEWDRHENLHDDVDQQSRTKERLYEEEMEVVWEKGGPGLVWYTDAQYWQQQEGDFDEETSDDWDVDYSVYLEENGGDKDARDALEMRHSDQWRLVGCDSVFNRNKMNNPKDQRFRNRLKTKITHLGSFELHTRGIGRRLLEKQGWKDGMGLGKATTGIAEALEPDGQKPRERKGLGYYGEALLRERSAVQNSKTRTGISTVYDDRLKSDPPEALLVRQPQTHMKYRKLQ